MTTSDAGAPITRTTFQTGTMDEIAGVPVGSGNAWVRDGWDGRISVLLAVDGEDHIVGEGDTVVIGNRRCTLERIEVVEGRGSHQLHFRIDPVDPIPPVDEESSPEPGSTASPRPAVPPVGGVSDRGDPAGPRRIVSTLTPPLALGKGEARSLRAAAVEVLALLAVIAGPIPETAWVREDREHWVEIDRVACGPNTDTVWSWIAPTGPGPGPASSGAANPGARCDVTWSTVRRNPDEIDRVSISGRWSDGVRSVHAHLDGSGGSPAGELTVSGPPEIIAAATRVVADHLATSPSAGR